MAWLSSLPQLGGLEEAGREESDGLGVELAPPPGELGALLGDWLLRILLKTRLPKTLPRVPLNRHELRALLGASEIAPTPASSSPASCKSWRIRPRNSSRISAMVPNRSRGFLASARSRMTWRRGGASGISSVTGSGS